MLIHAGRGIPALGLHAVELAGEFPDARLILAHAGICDLSWIWRVAPDHPNLFFDTAWWMPGDLIALFSLVPPGQILFASDAPYGMTALAPAFQLRIALQAGLSVEQIRWITAEQSLRIAAGGRSLPGRADRRARACAATCCSSGSRSSCCWRDRVDSRPGDGRRDARARTARLRRARRDDDAPVFASIRQLLDAYET